MMDLTHFQLLAAAMRDRKVWDAFDASGETAHVPEDLEPFVSATREFYETDPEATKVEPSLIGAATAGITRDPKRKELLRTTLKTLSEMEVSIPNAREAVRLLSRRRVSESLATKLLIPSKDGREQTLALIDEFLSLEAAKPEDEAAQWDADALAKDVGEPRIPIYPRSLGERLRGGLWPGHHMTAFARPEIGKSAFCTTVAVMAANRGKANVLYLTNEDPIRDLMIRTLVQFNRQPPEMVLADLHAAVQNAKALGVDRIRYADMTPGTLGEVDRLVRKYKPDLLIVDQLRNMLGGKNENMTQRLDSIMQGLRNVGKRHNISVLSVTQAGDSARDKAILDDGDVDNSNTGVSAGCDVLIGIGATPVMREAGERRLNIIKNKLGGTHGYVDVRLDPLTLSFRDKT